MLQNRLREYADFYLEKNLYPIPVERRGKRPLVDWKKYQTVPPTPSDLDRWFSDEGINLGIVMGRGVFAVDLDGGKEAEKLLYNLGVIFPENAPRARTGSGQHVFLRHTGPVPDKVGLVSTNGQKPQVDIRGVGYVVAAPSIHPSGIEYEWLIHLEDDIPHAPQALIDLIFKPKVQEKSSWVLEAMQGAKEGNRDAICTKLAGYFLGKKIEVAVVKNILSEFAKKCVPPFPQGEVNKCVESIASKEAIDGEDIPQVEPEYISDVMLRLSQSFDKPVKLISTSFEYIDRKLGGGFAPGELVYLGARPGVGKTLLALQIMISAARQGTPVLFISREMVNLALAKRLVAQASEEVIDKASLRTGNVNTKQKAVIAATAKELMRLPILMDDRSTSIEGLLDVVTRMARHEIGFVIVDYLQLLRTVKPEKDRRRQVEAVSHGLKNIAMQFKIPVLCMSSLSRPSNKEKENIRPTMASLRESGELEHDADTILFLCRAFRENTTECIIAKNRDGETGFVDLLFDPERLRFKSLDDVGSTDFRANGYQPEEE